MNPLEYDKNNVNVRSVKEAVAEILVCEKASMWRDVLIYHDGTWFATITWLDKYPKKISCKVGYRYRNGKSRTTAVEILDGTDYIRSDFQLKKAVKQKILSTMKAVDAARADYNRNACKKR